MTNDVAHREPQQLPSLRPKSYGQIVKIADMACNSGMVPKAYIDKPEMTAVAMMMLAENDLPVITGLKFVAVINGTPAFYGDAVPGIAQKRGLIRRRKEGWTGTGDSREAHCEVVNSAGDTFKRSFSVADAKRAKLWDRDTYKQYPDTMLMWRARNAAIRDAAPEAFMGPTVEELEQLAAAFVGPDNAKEVNPSVATSPLAPQIGTQSRREAQGEAAGIERLRSGTTSIAALAEDAGAIARRVVSGEDTGAGAGPGGIERDSEPGPSYQDTGAIERKLRAQALADSAGQEQPTKRRRGPPTNREKDERAAADLKDRAMAPDVDEMALDLIYQDEAFKRLEIRAKDLADEVTACVEQSRRELPEAETELGYQGWPENVEEAEPAEAPEAEETQQAASGKAYKMLDQNGYAFDELPAAEWLPAFAGYTEGRAHRKTMMLKNNRGIIEDLARDHPELEEQWAPMLAEARR